MKSSRFYSNFVIFIFTYNKESKVSPLFFRPFFNNPNFLLKLLTVPPAK
jgi:hypothetical protein